jgi:transcription elongation factor Elf1
MPFDKLLNERIPKRDDEEGHPLHNCPRCGSNNITGNPPMPLVQDNPYALIKCNSCNFYIKAPLWTLAVGLWNS